MIQDIFLRLHQRTPVSFNASAVVRRIYRKDDQGCAEAFLPKKFARFFEAIKGDHNHERKRHNIGRALAQDGKANTKAEFGQQFAIQVFCQSRKMLTAAKCPE